MAHPRNSESAPSSKSSSSAPSGETNRALNFYFLSLFPEAFSPFLESSLLGKARDRGRVGFHFIPIRDFAVDKHRTVDDTPFGGGEGMLMKVDVLHAAWEAAVRMARAEADCDGALSGEKIFKSGDSRTLTILMSPQGQLFSQEVARELVGYSNLIIVCGHYEGVDERFIELCVDREISIGDYVLTGGELPALVVADTVTRLLPGTVGNEQSVRNDSLESGWLKYPQYTRPREFQGFGVPDVLMSGDHQAIARWRKAEMERRTHEKRPDLLKKPGPRS